MDGILGVTRDPGTVLGEVERTVVVVKGSKTGVRNSKLV